MHCEATCNTRPPTLYFWCWADRTPLWCTFKCWNFLDVNTHNWKMHSNWNETFRYRYLVAPEASCVAFEELEDETRTWQREKKKAEPKVLSHYLGHWQHMASDSLICLLLPKIPLLVGLIHFPAKVVLLHTVNLFENAVNLCENATHII